MKLIKFLFLIFSLVSIVSCLKSDVCECTTYDSDGDVITIVSQGNLGGPDCDSQETVINSSGDTNYIICQIVRR